MARPKKRYPEREQALQAARDYLREAAPHLAAVPLRLQALDTAPGGPCYAVTAELCDTIHCPHRIRPAVAAAGNCPILSCAVRQSIRLLLNDQGEVVQATYGNVHWK